MISESVNWDSSTPWILDGKEVFDFDMEPVGRCATKNVAELVAAAPAVIGLLNEMLSAYGAGRIVGESQLWAMAQHALRQCGTNSFRHTHVPERRGHEDTPFSEVSFVCRLPRVPHRRDDYDSGDYYELGCELRAAAHAHRFMSKVWPRTQIPTVFGARVSR